jgi:hypothetical protein
MRMRKALDRLNRDLTTDTGCLLGRERAAQWPNYLTDDNLLLDTMYSLCNLVTSHSSGDCAVRLLS